MAQAEPFSFVLSSQDAFSAENRLSLIRQATPLARGIASKPPLVAIGKGSSGRVFIGFDVELPGLPPNYSIQAEQFLVTNLVLNSELKLDTLAISRDGYRYCSPYGHCCQFLQEIHKASEIKILVTDSHEKSMTLGTFLPQLHSPYNAIQEHVPDVLQPRNNGLTLIDMCAQPENCRHIKCKALAAANRSYAPYTNAASGVALRDSDGNVYSGSYIESVASFPSLGPVQAALVNFVMATGGRDFVKIVEAVLVETRNRYTDTAKMIIEKVANPECDFKVVHCSHRIMSETD